MSPLRDPVNPVPGGVGTDHLCDVHVLLQVIHGGQPHLPLDRDVEPMDNLHCLLLLLHHEPEVVPHVPGAHLQHLVWLGGGQ